MFAILPMISLLACADSSQDSSGVDPDDTSTSSTDPPEGTVEVVLTTTINGSPESCQLQVCTDEGQTCHQQNSGTGFTFRADDAATVEIGSVEIGEDSGGHPLHESSGHLWTAPRLTFAVVDGQVNVSGPLGLIDSLTPVDGRVEFSQPFAWYYDDMYSWSRHDYGYDAEASDYRGADRGEVDIENSRLWIETLDGYLLDTCGFHIADQNEPERYTVSGVTFVANGSNSSFVNNFTMSEDGTVAYDLVMPDFNTVSHIEGEI